MAVNDAHGSFVVRVAGRLTGRGTAIGGYVDVGDVRAGDALTWTVDGHEHHARCRQVNGVRELPMQEPPCVLLVVDATIDPAQFHEGMRVTIRRPDANPATC